MQNKDNNDILANDIDENSPEEQDNEITPLIDDYDEYSQSDDYEPEQEDNEDDSAPAPPPVREAPRKRKKKKKKKKRSRLPGIIILTTFIFAVSV